ncbi:MAG: hypothetical protein PHQ91_07870 [Thermoanaerobaculaceae bacterium]|nr:hypothetical protein [Thermoanaerobaculaceae bacterium]TAM44701.1 MAG: hypothetical protein EPN53_16135 [Acidobacteriota bacterium]
MTRTAWWFWPGAALIAAGMGLAAARVGPVAQNLTPLCWTGFIVAVDGALARHGRSWLRNAPLELALMAAISIPSWLLFELYDRPRFWSAAGPELWWHYSGLPPWPWRGLGYAWSFATITPAIVLLAEAFEPAAARLAGRGGGGRVPRELLAALIAVGTILAAIPLLWPSVFFAADVWLAWPLLLDPVNRLMGRPSLLGDLEQGRRSRPLALLASGLACGLLWESWNMLASARWRYTVPFLGSVKLYEMPVLGFLGFVPFALGAFALYHFLRGLLPGDAPRG